MAETELKLHDILARLPAPVTPLAAPAELWPRIAAAHTARLRRRRVLRIAAASSAVVFLALALVWRAAAPAAVDWQARAQALELQLDTLPLPAAADPAARLAESELARVDRTLQSAYDHGAQAGKIAPLWRRRSELLDALLAVRRQQTLSTRI